MSSAKTFFLQNTQRFLFAAVITLFFACSHLQFPGAYQLDIPQGNIINEKEVAQLAQGMTKEQVRYLLGSPLASNDLRPNLWTYIYTFHKGNDNTERKRLDLTFNEKGVLVDISK